MVRAPIILRMKVPQISTFELLYRCESHGVVDIIRENGRRHLLIVRPKFNTFLSGPESKTPHLLEKSLVVSVPKSHGSFRFCVDFRNLNTVSKFDAYPLPCIDELLERVSVAPCYSTLDLSKDYWQVSWLQCSGGEKKIFFHSIRFTPICHPPVWIVWSPSNVSASHGLNAPLTRRDAYADANLDDVIIYSSDWQQHLRYLTAVVRSLRWVGRHLQARQPPDLSWAVGVCNKGVVSTALAVNGEEAGWTGR